MSIYRQQLEEWLKTIDVKGDIVYDIGGAQGPVRGRVKSWDVNYYRVLDLPDNDMNKGIFFSPDMKADYIFCLEVFEYLINPVRGIKNIAAGLKKGGKAYVTFAFVYPHHNELELDSLRYTESAIIQLAKIARLKVNQIWHRADRSGLLQQFYQADGMHPAKQFPNHNVTGFIVEFRK